MDNESCKNPYKPLDDLKGESLSAFKPVAVKKAAAFPPVSCLCLASSRYILCTNALQVGIPRSLQGVWASRAVTGEFEDGSSGDEDVLVAGKDEESAIDEVYTEECGKDDPRSSPSVCPRLFLLITFLCNRILDFVTVTIFQTRVCSTSGLKGVRARRARIASVVRRQELRLKRQRYTCVLHALRVGLVFALPLLEVGRFWPYSAP